MIAGGRGSLPSILLPIVAIKSPLTTEDPMKFRLPARMALLDAIDLALVDGLISLMTESTGSIPGCDEEEDMPVSTPADGGDDEKA